MYQVVSSRSECCFSADDPDLEKVKQRSSRHDAEVFCGVTEMVPRYEWADAVISAGGALVGSGSLACLRLS